MSDQKRKRQNSVNNRVKPPLSSTCLTGGGPGGGGGGVGTTARTEDFSTKDLSELRDVKVRTVSPSKSTKVYSL